jgi:competence protein ComEC
MTARETATQGETLRTFTWRDAILRVRAAASSLPTLVASGWQADALRRGLFVPALAGLGAGAYFALPFEPPLVMALLAPAAIIAWFAAARSASAAWPTALACVAACITGFALTTARTHIVATEHLASETRLLTIRARVEHTAPADNARTRLWLSVFETKPALVQTPKRVRISIGKLESPIASGEWIEVRARLKPLPAPVAPGAYDFGRTLWFQGIGAVGFSLHPIKRIVAPRDPTTVEAISDAMSRFRRNVSDRILAALPPRSGPIAAALLTGERGLISDEDNEAMRDSSLAHLLSISGLHMALAGFGFFAALRLIFALIPAVSLKYPVKKWAAAGALAASAFYLVLSGASVPTQRSFVMIAVALVAIIFDRSALSMRTIAIAAAVVMVLTPEAWMDPSFQMSFGAVAALIAAYEWWTARRIPDAEPPGIFVRAARMIGAAAATSFIAGLATAPFAAYHFNRFSDYGVVANVIVMPLVSFVIMPAGVLALLLMPLGLEAIPLAVMGEGIEAMLGVAHWVASWPGATQSVGALPIEALTLMTAGGLWAAVWQAKWRWLGVIPIVAGLAMAAMSRAPDVLIADDGDNVAVRGNDNQLHLLSSRRGRFDAEIWLRRDGDSRVIEDVQTGESGGFVCDAAGCKAQVNGNPANAVVIARSLDALVEDCKPGTIVVDLTRGWHPLCTNARLHVTRRMLQREGAIAASLNGDQIEWTSVARVRGERPWVAKKISNAARARSTGPEP